MASYRFSASVIGRSSGGSATAAAAYRHAERIDCDRYGDRHDYTRKRGVVHSEIMAPENAPDWMRDRAKLWNGVEAAEKRKDAQLAREVQLSLPHELDHAQRVELVRGFVAEQFVARGMIADVAIHAPGKDGDDRNHHAHIMLTMRELTGAGFGQKAREWNDPANLEHWREEWAHHQNREFERLNLAVRVDHRSFEAQGIDREPEQHEGVHATAMKRKKQETRIGSENTARQERNSARAWQHVEALKELAKIAAERSRFDDWAADRIGQLEAAQHLSRLDQTRALELKAEVFEERLQAFYSPHLKTVEAEAGKIQQRLDARGILPSLRRFWSGREDRRKLDDIQATVADTRNRMQEARSVFMAKQKAERSRLTELQQSRAAQQKEGLETAKQRKEQALKSRENAARALWEKATDPEKAAAQAERDRRLAWYEQKKGRTQEAEAIDRPEQQPVSAREALDRELHDRAKGLDTRFNNSRLHVNRDVIERVERTDHNAQYEKNMKAKAEAEAPAKAAELARLREIAANRLDEISRQDTPAQQPAQKPDRTTDPQTGREADKPPAYASQSEFQKQAAQPVPEPQQEGRNAARALWENAAQQLTPQPEHSARALWENATPEPKPEPAREQINTPPAPERSNER